MNRFAAVGSMVFAVSLAGCNFSRPMAPKQNDVARLTTQAAMPSDGSTANAGSVNGAGGKMPAFYDHKMFTINVLELSDVAAAHVGANPSHNNIYVTNDLDDEQDFDAVLDAIQGDGFNPLWEQILIVFNPGVTPHQFFSDDEVLGAAAGPHPDITLVDTHEVYRCSVVGPK